MSFASVRIVKTVALDEVIAEAQTAYLNGAMLTLHSNIAQPGVVPIDKGILRASLSPGGGTTAVDSAKPPKWAKVGTRVKYGRPLDRSKRFHYARGPSAGKPTQGWLSDAPERAARELDQLAQKFADAIEGGWKRG